MSDQNVIIIPEQPEFVPDHSAQQEGVSFFASITPPGTEINALVSSRIKFIDCGENFEDVRCPACGATIDIETWQSWMNADFDGKGFNLNQHQMKCCGSIQNLNDLKYHFAQGFARFQLSAMNPNIGELSDKQISRFTHIFGCPVRIIYRHI